MSTAPKIKHVHYDGTCPIMDRNQIDTLILGDESNTDTTLVRELFDLFVNEGATKCCSDQTHPVQVGYNDMAAVWTNSITQAGL